jgi:SAM-dependent methyltransferase
MTPEMVARARETAQKGDIENVEFRLGEIEHLPVADNSVDAIISNCVINLSPDKPRVFREAFRVLKPGGRLMISDTVLLGPLPGFLLESVAAYVGCVSGAMRKQEYIDTIEAAGFQDMQIVKETPFSLDCVLNDPMARDVTGNLQIPAKKEVEGCLASILINAIKR